jgi:hypothetical protein
MFAMRGKDGIECRALRLPTALNQDHNCAWFDKIPLADRLFKLLRIRKPQFLTARGVQLSL